MKTIVYLLFVSVLLISGCQRLPEKPEGLPELYPCKIAVTFGGKTIEGVQVALEPKSSLLKKWRSGGTTNAKGDAILTTSFCYDGVPAGKYRLSFAKSQERHGNTIEEMTPLSLIPLKYSPDKSKMELEIKQEENAFTFELDGGEELFPIPKGTRIPQKMIRKGGMK